MIYGYIRVSTDKQTVENQRFEISEYCKNQNIIINEWIEETISGTVSVNKRNLGKLLNKVKTGDTIICTELSRLGRSMFMIMSVLNLLMEQNVKIYTVKEGYKLGDDLQSKVLAFAFSISAEIERSLISQRTTEALKRRKSEGIILGRPKGHKNAKLKLDENEDYILCMLANGYSKVFISKYFKVSEGTVYNFINRKNFPKRKKNVYRKN